MVTAQQVITEVRDILDEPTAAQWSDAQFARWINEANRDLARTTRHLKSTSTVTTTAGVSKYTLSPDFLAIEHAWWRSHYSVPYNILTPRYPESMELIHGGDVDRAGTPQYFWTEGVSPNLTIVIWPTPTKSGYMSLLTARLPAAIGPTSLEIDVPNAWYDALVDYCEYKALRRDRDPRWKEAFDLYNAKRDALVHNVDYLPIAREMVPDPHAGYLPSWLVEFD